MIFRSFISVLGCFFSTLINLTTLTTITTLTILITSTTRPQILYSPQRCARGVAVALVPPPPPNLGRLAVFFINFNISININIYEQYSLMICAFAYLKIRSSTFLQIFVQLVLRELLLAHIH